MSKRNPGQVVLDAIDASICLADQLMADMVMTTKDGKHAQSALRAWPSETLCAQS